MQRVLAFVSPVLHTETFLSFMAIFARHSPFSSMNFASQSAMGSVRGAGIPADCAGDFSCVQPPRRIAMKARAAKIPKVFAVFCILYFSGLSRIKTCRPFFPESQMLPEFILPFAQLFLF